MAQLQQDGNITNSGKSTTPNEDDDSALKELYNSLSPRTTHLYKTIILQYINWCQQDNVNILGNDTNIEGSNIDVILRDHNIPITTRLIHRFIIDTIIITPPTNNINNNIDLNDSFLIEGNITCTIKAMKFAIEIIKIFQREHEKNDSISINNYKIDEFFLNQIIKLHQSFKSFDPLPLFKISINLWNPITNNLNESYFKTSLEKLRFLVDFHFTNYLKLPYNQRSNIKLASLKVSPSSSQNINNNNTIYYDPYDDNKNMLHTPMGLLPQDCPLLCPFTSLASYLFLKFYGIKSFSRGDGFPNLLNDNDFKHLPLVKGKNNFEYPRDTTLGIYYSTVFKYCNLSYKRKNYFDTNLPNFPFWNNDDEFNEFIKTFNNNTDNNYNEIVPFDYLRILNWKSPYVPKDSSPFVSDFSKNLINPPTSIINKFFPEIESYENKSEQISSLAINFLNLLKMLRFHFVRNLPIIHKIFPHHDIFKNNIFQNTDLQLYLNDLQITNQSNNNIIKFSILPNFPNNNNVKLNDFYSYLIEKPQYLIDDNINEPRSLKVNNNRSSANSNTNIATTTTTTTINNNINDREMFTSQQELLNDLREQNFQFIQFQTLSNFKSFIILISKLFNNLSIKNSSKREITKQLNYYNDLLQEKIKNSTPRDIKDYFLKNEILKHSENLIEDDNQISQPPKIKRSSSTTSYRLFNIDGYSSDTSMDSVKNERVNKIDDDNEGEELNNSEQEEELKDLVDELVTNKVDSMVRNQMLLFEQRMELMVDDLIEKKLDKMLKEKLKRKLDDSEDDSDTYNNNDNNINTNRFENFNNDSRKRMKPVETNFTLRVKEKTSSLSSPFTLKKEVKKNNDSFDYKTPTNLENISRNQKENMQTPGLSNETPLFVMSQLINNIEDVLVEWYTPNPQMNNECVHSMNKKYGKLWRSNFQSLYKTRKPIVEFYVYLINELSINRYQAITICNDLKDSKTIEEFSMFLKDWKKHHQNSFKGLYEA